MIVTHLYGRMARMSEIMATARERGLYVIEDCAQAHGAMQAGRRAGAWGDLGCYSFYPTKNLGALGDGGAIVTNDASLASRARRLRQYGWEQRGNAVLEGGRNSRLDEVQAAVLSALLPYLDGDNQRRREIARQYDAVCLDAGIRALDPRGDDDDVVHLYVVTPDDRLSFSQRLEEARIGYGVHYPFADHRQHAFADRVALADAMKDTDWLCGRVVSLPCFAEMTAAEIEHVCAVLAKIESPVQR